MSKTSYNVASTVRASILSFALLLNAACAGASIQSAPQNLSNESYRVDSGDTLNVTIFGQNDLGGKFLVGAEGAITIPLAGAVPVREKTLIEVKEAVESA
ncbi:MAG: polysaccharide biosynthesis/export family protein, partial [Thalassospira sp.]|nr:polysaccharide biosynthesis/export family protein [Thalassospira sp.]